MAMVKTIIEICALVVSLAAFCLGLIEFIKKSRLERASLLSRLLSTIRKDPSIKNIFYRIEYGEFHYSLAIHTTDEEKDLDSLLSFLNQLCYLKDANLLKDDEFSQFKYYINRVMLNGDVQNYLYNVYHFAKKQNSDYPYDSLLKNAEKERQIDEKFFKITGNSGYDRILNF